MPFRFQDRGGKFVKRITEVERTMRRVQRAIDSSAEVGACCSFTLLLGKTAPRGNALG